MNGVLLIRFSIEKLNELPGPYDFQTGFLVGKAVPARLLRGMTILQGDRTRGRSESEIRETRRRPCRAWNTSPWSPFGVTGTCCGGRSSRGSF